MATRLTQGLTPGLTQQPANRPIVRRIQPPSRPPYPLSLLLAGCLLVGACTVGPSPSTSTGHVQPIAVTRHTARPAVAYQDCGDRSSSFPPSLLQRSDARVATWLDGLVQDNSGPFWFIYNYIDNDPLSPSAAPLSFTVPATPSYPLLQLPPKPTPSSNTYQYGQDMAQWQQTSDQLTAQFNAAAQGVRAQLAALSAPVHTFTTTLRALRPPVEQISTSVYGCLYTAATRFAHWPGAKLVTITSDLLNNTSQDVIGHLTLTGFTIWVTYFPCVDAATCEQLKATWTRVLSAAGATVSFYDAPTSDQLQSPWAQLSSALAPTPTTSS